MRYVTREAIKIYVLKDKSRGKVWIVESPNSVELKCGKKYANKKWCFSISSLMKRIHDLSEQKILLK
jgi:hypothetical protein